MYLKKLEIYGFKSFAERIEMTFGQGITGVVGPNGCGKSNIGDAVRWVLGEQNARVLRGGKMEDVIFSGTERRKPLAYCEVSLLFDNEQGYLPVDYNEVMVTRRVYRSGESEYFLNKTACRLKDITDLFRDTGIGKEGYSLVGQGRIDEILSVRSEDRRNVFEEAAGISKYKARKQEAERRVEHTEQNLARVEDILEELSSQLAPLAEQAETARRYISLSGELKTLELNDFVARHDGAKERLAALEEQQQALEQEGQTAALAEENLRAQIGQAQDAIAAMEGELSAAREDELTLTRQVEAREGRVNLLKEQGAQLARDLARLSQEDAAARQALESLERQDQGLDPDLAQQLGLERAQIEALEAEATSAASDIALREADVNLRKASLIENMNRLGNVQSATARLTAMGEGLRERLEVLSSAQENTSEQHRQAQEALAEAEALQGEAEEALGGIRAQGLALREEAEGLAASRDEAAQALSRTQGALREAQSRLKMLRQMERDYEGYNNAVREVMRGARGDAGVLGVVAEVLRVPKEIERAIDMALGGQLQNIVCRTQEDAKRHIDRLRQNKAGRATFLPLDAIRGRTLNPQERECLLMPGCVGLASELVGYDEVYRPVAENLLGRTVVAADLTSGIAIMRRARHAFRLVTLQGDVMHSGGSMTGGSVQSRMTSLLSRERELGEYEGAIARLTQREAEAASSLAAIEEGLDQARSQLIHLQDQAHEQEIALEREQSRKSHARALLDERQEAFDKLLTEREQIESSLRDIQEELSSMQNLAGGEEQSHKEAQEEIALLAEELAQSRAQLEALREGITARRVKLASAEREHEASLRDQSRRDQERAGLLSQAQARKLAVEELELQIKNNLGEVDSQAEALIQAREELDEKRGAYRTREIRRTALQQGLRDLLEKREENQALQESLTEKLHRAEVQSSRLQADLENMIGRIWDSYEMTYAGAMEFALPDFDQKQAGPRIEAMRREIRAMGSVNTAAIEDYRATSERHESMRAQRDDLVRAKKDLQQIILELTSRMEEQFTSQFAILNRNFNRTFIALFGGGRAELRLSDEKNPLTCGIEIVAQPPGKRLQLLSLLSGGERALTAIAILFAMLGAKPTPFCILDEIEAALDDSNIANFARYLADYSRSTQFIVVTHRKGTMECCDSLYGISMEEKGVSSMVSVELSAVENLHNIG